MSQTFKAGGFGLVLLLVTTIWTGNAAAQINLSGQWNGFYHEDQPDRLPGPELGDYGGLPLNDADRKRAQAWSASILSLPLYQCRVHPVDYASSFAQIRVWEDVDPKTQQGHRGRATPLKQSGNPNAARRHRRNTPGP